MIKIFWQKTMFIIRYITVHNTEFLNIPTWLNAIQNIYISPEYCSIDFQKPLQCTGLELPIIYFQSIVKPDLTGLKLI